MISPSFVIGTVQTLSAGSNAYATITGSQAIPVLNLGIPQGPKGSNGDSGDGGAVAEAALTLATTDAANLVALDAVVATRAGTITALTGAVSGLSADVSAQQAQITTVMNRTSGMYTCVYPHCLVQMSRFEFCLYLQYIYDLPCNECIYSN